MKVQRCASSLTASTFSACVELCPTRQTSPHPTLRDLLGIVRALFATWTRQKVGPIELEELAHIGKELSAALKLARKTEAGTLGHRAAWSRAEEATRGLGHLVGTLEPLHPTIEAATHRALGTEPRRVEGTTASKGLSNEGVDRFLGRR